MTKPLARWMLLAFTVLALQVSSRGAEPAADEPPVIPVGLDAYRQWDKWPLQRIGVRAYMRSTYDRAGRNEGADASHFLYQKADDFNVTLDVAGHPGILYFTRYNHWHGSPWHYVVDGTDHVIRETSTADPLKPVPNSIFEPAAAFPKPLAWTWSDTKGADLSWVPIGFERSFTLAYSRTRYGTGYYIWHQFAPGTKLSQPVKAWDGKTPPDGDVLELLDKSGTDIVPDDAAGAGGTVMERVSFAPGQRERFLPVLRGSGMVREIQISVPREDAIKLARLRLVAYWDERRDASIDVPVPLFFGAGTLYNRDDREYLVKAFPVSIRFDAGRVTLRCYFPMPFERSARIGLVAQDDVELRDVALSVRRGTLDGPSAHYGYFHATYRDHPTPERGKDLVLLDTRDAEGGGDWSGSFVGTSFIFSHNANLTTLEGDPRFYFDDAKTPQAYGTGTEEWGGGGDYWGGRNMTLPFAGHPCGAKSAKDAKNDLDKIQSAYRFLLADLFPFGKNARITLEHGGENESKEHYETVAYWYGAPRATLVQTDTLSVGDAADETAHAYASPTASEPYDITSKYEIGVGTVDGKVIHPPFTMRGRKMTGTSEFTLKVDPNNWGVLLRRTLDYALPNQRAEVFVADVSEAAPRWKAAGVWYLAGSNTCVYSNPKGELGATQHNVQTSNRRFRDDEFLIGRDLTRGRDKIRVRVKFTPVEIPLFPGHPLPELGWSEIRYDAYSYVMPN
jgi:hypothetical protein